MRYVALVLAQEAQEAPVVGVRHVEQLHHQFVVARRPREPLRNDPLELRPGEIPVRERSVHCRPERLATIDHPRDELIFHRPCAGIVVRAGARRLAAP